MERRTILGFALAAEVLFVELPEVHAKLLSHAGRARPLLLRPIAKSGWSALNKRGVLSQRLWRRATPLSRYSDGFGEGEA